jgi:hypothetical protein
MTDEQQCVAVLTNLLYRHDFERVVLGDLFIEDATVRFIPYGGFRSSVPVMKAAAAALGGVVGALSNSQLDGSLREAVPNAKKARTLEWGCDPKIERNATRLFEIHKPSMNRVGTEGGIVFGTTSGSIAFGYAFGVDQETYASQVKSWLTGSLAHGANLAQPNTKRATMSRPQWPDSLNSPSDDPGTIHLGLPTRSFSHGRPRHPTIGRSAPSREAPASSPARKSSRLSV